MNKFIAMLLLVGLSLACAAQVAEAKLPYRTYYYDQNQGQWQRIQAVYTPVQPVAIGLDEPVDLTVGGDGNIYVADKGNSRIYVLRPDGTLLRTIGEEEGEAALSAPEGVFVTPQGLIYVADSGNARIAVFQADGAFMRAYGKPAAAAFEGEYFVPQKLVVDRRGVMYIALNTSYQGLVRLSADGDFMGYFGANKARPSLMSWLKKLVLNKEQLEKELANLPLPIKNVALDSEGFIYTATAGGWGQGAIRKLNAGGVDALKNKTVRNGHGIVDMAIDQDGFLYSIDTEEGRVTVYDARGEALFAFSQLSTETQQYGILGFPTAIAVDASNQIWIADSRTKAIHRFTRTAFGKDALAGLALYQAGNYAGSKPYWEAVYMRNDMYNGTFQGLGKVYLQEGNDEQALAYMQLAFDTEGYSRAFWQIRLQWLQQHFLALCAGIIAVLALAVYGSRLLRKWLGSREWLPGLAKFGMDMRNFGYILFHPYEGFYRLKETKVSGAAIVAVLGSVVALKVASLYLTGFIFNPVELSQINLVNSLGLFVLPWATWIAANYLVCSVKDGEGKFREVFQGSTFALVPYLFFSIPILVLSNLVTLNERVLVDALTAIMYLWLLAMFFVMTQVIHNFEFIETLKNSAITLFTIFVIWLFGFLVFGLSFNFYDFFYQLYQEVIFFA